ncbi:hypothetical protein [Frankia sp. Cppng1_Ct_nod]|uniref:hypothetical protein n=1 Tax=Frankia sp. Cppng1_Ct_nod TaxID=2897162 RepID=UPI001041233B|nr:hypothetical protein [Frankia sp. Cppng1_Ct_nod]
MRLGRTRLALACVLGSAMVGLSTPAAWATNDSVAPAGTPSATPSIKGSATPAGIETPAVPPTPTVSASVSPPPAAPSPTATSSLPVPPIPTGLPSGIPDIPPDMLKDLLDLVPWLPTDLPDDLSGLKPQPLVITYTCGPKGPNWKIRNTSAKAFGFGWFDTDLNGEIGEIKANQTISLRSSAIAVLATPFDPETGQLLLAIPAIGVALCPGAEPHVTPTPTASSGSTGATTTAVSKTVPVATAAKPIVTDSVHFTG